MPVSDLTQTATSCFHAANGSPSLTRSADRRLLPRALCMRVADIGMSSGRIDLDAHFPYILGKGGALEVSPGGDVCAGSARLSSCC